MRVKKRFTYKAAAMIAAVALCWPCVQAAAEEVYEDDIVWEEEQTGEEEILIPQPGLQYVVDFDPQPENTGDIMAILDGDSMPCWEHPVDEGLLPEGFALKEIERAEHGITFYSMEYVGREATVREVGTATALREAFADLVDGDVIVLTTSVELGALAATDGSTATLNIPSGVQVTLRADEGGPYRLYRRDGMRHFALRGVKNSTLVFEGVVLQGLYTEGSGKLVYSGGVEIDNCQDVTLQGLEVQGTAASVGGAVRITDSENICMENTSLLAAAAHNGGGLAAFASTVTLVGGNIAGNTAELGGGVYAENGEICLAGTVVQDNEAEWGGGMHLSGGTSALMEENAALRGNMAVAEGVNTTAQGGGARLTEGAALTLEGAAIENNLARAEKGNSLGGGLAVCGSAALAARGAVIGGNTAEAGRGIAYGGGIYLGKGNEATTLQETEIVGNYAEVGGGTYLNEGASLPPEQMEGVNLQGNDAYMGRDTYLHDDKYEDEEAAADTIVTVDEFVVPMGGAAGTVPYVQSGGAAPAVVFIPMDLSPAETAAALTWSPAGFALVVCSALIAAVMLLALVPSRFYRCRGAKSKVQGKPRGLVVWAIAGLFAAVSSLLLYMLALSHASGPFSAFTLAQLGLLALQLGCACGQRIAAAPVRRA